jgi:hypothetical protein
LIAVMIDGLANKALDWRFRFSCHDWARREVCLRLDCNRSKGGGRRKNFQMDAGLRH